MRMMRIACGYTVRYRRDGSENCKRERYVMRDRYLSEYSKEAAEEIIRGNKKIKMVNYLKEYKYADLSYAADQEIDRLVAVRDRHEETQKRNFDREFDAEQVRNAVAKRSGIYEAYKDTNDRYFYYQQIVMLARKP